jgi:predicted metal-binding membrane protein
MVGLSAANRSRNAAELVLRDRFIIWLGLAAVTALSWFYVYRQMGAMEGVAEIAMPVAVAPWTTVDFALNLAIWWAMMPGMMLPGAAPTILTYATVNRRKRERGQPFVPTMVFMSGYLIAWGLFGVFATLADWGLEHAALISPTTGRLSPILGAIVVTAAGIYQLTPLKSVCLTHCRSPFDFVLNRWQDGTAGALRMGLEHGIYCLGCCWFLMALLFAAGIMSLLWMAAITIFVFIEKLFPAGQWIARASGVAMLGFGAYLFSQV